MLNAEKKVAIVGERMALEEMAHTTSETHRLSDKSVAHSEKDNYKRIP